MQELEIGANFLIIRWILLVMECWGMCLLVCVGNVALPKTDGDTDGAFYINHLDTRIKHFALTRCFSFSVNAPYF